MKNINVKIGLAVFAFALMVGISASDAYAFGGERGQRLNRPKVEKQGLHEKNSEDSRKGAFENKKRQRREISDEAKEFHEDQRADFEDFIGLDKGELKELHASGEKMSETLEDQNIDEDEMRDFLEGQVDDLIDFIGDEKKLDDDELDDLEERMNKRTEHQIDRWYN